MHLLKREEIERIRAEYLPGTRIKLLYMKEESIPSAGTKGTVKGVNNMGDIMVRWDNNSSLNIVLEVDKIEILKKTDELFLYGQIVSHFKRGMLSPEELTKEPNKYLYRVIDPAVINTETDKSMVIYQALYAPFLTFASNNDDAKKFVNWNMYPDVPVNRRQPYVLTEYNQNKGRLT